MTSHSLRISGDIPRDLSQQTHRRLIGVLGFLLPILLYLVAGLRPTAPLLRWTPLDSVSAYYYTGAVAILVGVLFALSLFSVQLPGLRKGDCRSRRRLRRGRRCPRRRSVPDYSPKRPLSATLVELYVKNGALCVSGRSLPIVHPFCCLALSQIKCS